MEFTFTFRELRLILDSLQLSEGMAADGVRFYEGEFDEGMYEHHRRAMDNYRKIIEKVYNQMEMVSA